MRCKMWWTTTGLKRCALFVTSEGDAQILEGGASEGSSIPSGKVEVRSACEMVRASIGSRESQLRVTSGGRRCGYCLRCAMR